MSAALVYSVGTLGDSEAARRSMILRWAEVLGVELLTPPLYYVDRRGRQQRIWTPPAARKADLRVEVYGRDDFTCQSCGERFDAPDEYDGVKNIDGLSLGHIIDYRDGGPYVAANLRTECGPCNLATAYMTPPGTPCRDRELVGTGAYGSLDPRGAAGERSDRPRPASP